VSCLLFSIYKSVVNADDTVFSISLWLLLDELAKAGLMMHGRCSTEFCQTGSQTYNNSTTYWSEFCGDVIMPKPLQSFSLKIDTAVKFIIRKYTSGSRAVIKYFKYYMYTPTSVPSQGISCMYIQNQTGRSCKF